MTLTNIYDTQVSRTSPPAARCSHHLLFPKKPTRSAAETHRKHRFNSSGLKRNVKYLSKNRRQESSQRKPRESCHNCGCAGVDEPCGPRPSSREEEGEESGTHSKTHCRKISITMMIVKQGCPNTEGHIQRHIRRAGPLIRAEVYCLVNEVIN